MLTQIFPFGKSDFFMIGTINRQERRKSFVGIIIFSIPSGSGKQSPLFTTSLECEKKKPNSTFGKNHFLYHPLQ